jgi:hypothetical protein
MNRLLITLAAVAALFLLTGCGKEAKLKDSLKECLALDGRVDEPSILSTDEYFSKIEYAPKSVKLDFVKESAILQIVEIAHWAPTQRGPGGREAAERLKPAAGGVDRDYSSTTTYELVYQLDGDKWRVRSGAKRFATIKGSSKEARAPETFGDSELIADLMPQVNEFGEYSACLVDDRLTQAK